MKMHILEKVSCETSNILTLILAVRQFVRNLFDNNLQSLLAMKFIVTTNHRQWLTQSFNKNLRSFL